MTPSKYSLLAQAHSYIAYARATELMDLVTYTKDSLTGEITDVAWTEGKGRQKIRPERMQRAAYWLDCAARDIRRIR